MNQNVVYCRNALRRSLSDGKIKNGDTLIVSFFHPDGRYDTEYIKADTSRIAATICANEYDKLFCDASDYALFSTIGRELDAHIGLKDNFIEKLLEALSALNKK